MGTYTTRPGLDKVLVPLNVTPSTWGLAHALAAVGSANPHYGSGKGAARRSSYEHQIDRVDDLVAGAAVQGTVITLESGHGIRRRRHQLYVWELLYAPNLAAPRWVRVYRRRIIELLDWLGANHPDRLGWAHRQSRRRTSTNPQATRYYLPRGQWASFWAWRRGYDVAVRLLVTLDAWWHRGEPAPPREAREALAARPRLAPSPIPAPRAASARPEAEQGPRGSKGETQDETGCRDRSPASVGELLRRGWPMSTA